MKKNVLILSLVLLITAGIFLTLGAACKVAEKDTIDKSELEICEETEEKSEENKIINILLLGVDKEENASDTIMILSLNENAKTIKLVSIMRDTYVYQGEGMANKINYAYHYGGVKGSINTVNNVFNLDISKYIKVNFNDLINLVDYLGGVEVNINEEERGYINASCEKASLNECGNVTLNGEQALAFSRIRAIDSDFERTERQRKVMFGIFNKIKSMEAYKYPGVIYELNDVSQTNLSPLELLEYSSVFLSYDEYSLSQFRIPIDGTWRDNTEGVYHLDWNEEVNKNALHEFIYG